MEWKYFKPEFEFNRKIHSTWWGHTWFAYDLVRNTKPKCIVELGTHYGVSFFSMCQAVKDEKIECELNAVDTWEGDAQAKIGYDKKDYVFNVFKDELESNFKDLKIKLHRKKFDEALEVFKDNSIDILHIDGFHSYEAVKHDFETWLTKVKENGIILFHDICEEREGFGVHILWSEIKEKYKTTEFEHYHGLGVLFKGGNYEKFLDLEYVWRNYYRLVEENNNLKIKLDFLEDHKIKAEKEIYSLKEENRRIKSSKFWKLRNLYIKLKHQFIFVFLSPRKFIKKYLKF